MTPTSQMGTAMSNTGVNPGVGDGLGHADRTQLFAVPDLGSPDLTLVIPTRNEVANVDALVQRLTASLKGVSAEIIFVDDSDDDTPGAIAEVARRTTIPIRLLHREPDAREGGLSTAVLSGMRAARAPWALVMDADLQHPPEGVPQLFATARPQFRGP